MATKHKKRKKHKRHSAKALRAWRRNIKKARAARRRKLRRRGGKKTRKCPKSRKHATLRSAKLCLLRRKRGRASKSLKKLYAKCKKMLRRTKGGRKWLKKHGLARRRAKK